MQNSGSIEQKEGPYLSLNPSELVLLVFPGWVIMFYFKTGISVWFTSQILSLSEGSKAFEITTFFVANTIKVFLLLLLVIFLAGVIRTWLPELKIRNKLNKFPPLLANLIAALLGVISPFCSCSAIPVFISFLEAGIPLGITFSFLIASPLVNEIILIMLVSLFGWKIAIIYLFAGLLIAIVSGFVIDRLKLERHLPFWLLNFRNQKNAEIVYNRLDDRVKTAFTAVREVISRTYLYILAGLMVGSIFHGYIPSDFLFNYTDSDNWFSVPLIVLAGIPLYSCSAAIAPIAFVLVSKGMPIGTALAFIMSVAGLSLPEFILLRKVLSIRLLLSFITIVFLGIILTGYLFNWIL